MKKKFNICILSNNNDARVNPVKEILKVKGFANAKKPSKYAYDKALHLLNSSSNKSLESIKSFGDWPNDVILLI